jgi:hypothetical protein
MAKEGYPGRPGVVFALLLIAALALAAPVAAGTIVTVSNGNDLASAVTSSTSETIILNPGTYYESGMTVGNNKIIEADTANGHGPWDTIIDGSHSGNSIFEDSSYSLAIDNLTIRNGVSSVTGTGGAIYDSGGSVTVTSSIFTGCSASSSGYSTSYGGAIYDSGGSVTVTSSIFTGCSASSSGYGTSYGGAIYDSGGSVTVTSSTFTGCSATSSEGANGGAIFAGSVTVTSSTFTGCSATGVSGTGIGGAISASSVTVTSSTFTRCSASSSGSGGYGGAISAGSDDVHIRINFCRIYQNPVGTAVYDNQEDSRDVSDTWWGTNSGPSSSDIGGGSFTTSPWLVLGITASPSTITTGGTSIISANLTYNSAGSNTAGSGMVPDGTTVAFTVTGGTLSTATAYTGSGVAYTIFTPSSTGTAYITATVDGQTVTVPVTVTSGSSGTTTINATSIVIDSSTPSHLYAGLDGAGIYNSTDSGNTWTAAITQPANTHIRALVIDPVDHTKLFAGTYGGGVNQSIDSGMDWLPCTDTGLSNLNVLSLVADSTGKLYAGTENGVFTSSDNCNTWTSMNGGLP